MSHPLGTRKLAQVAFVVRDIEASAQRWAALLGVEVPAPILVGSGNDTRMTYRGVPSNATCKLALFDLGGVQLELIQPLGDDSAWAEPLLAGGEGFHHIAFWVENMAEAKQHLESHGVVMSQRGDMGEGQYAYSDGSGPIATTLELLENKRTELS